MKKKVILATIILVVLLLNLDYIVVIDDYVKAVILFGMAGALTIFEYKRNKSRE